MFIQTETTPNPNVLKFLPGRTLLDHGSLEFLSLEEAVKSPLAEALFALDGVGSVFFGTDFLTITRHPETGLDWALMKAPILAVIMDHFTSGQALLRQAQGETEALETQYEGEAAQIVAEIKDVLDQRVRPAVAQDGGDILFDRFDLGTGVLYLRMRGACAGCPSSTATLKSGIENMMRHYVPEVTAVEQSL